MKIPRSLLITAVIIFSLALAGAALFAAQASNQPDPDPPPLSEVIGMLAEPSDRSVIRLYFDDRQHLDQVAGQLDIWEVDPEDGYAVVALSPEKRHWLEVLGYRMELDPDKTDLIQAPMAPLDPRFHYFDEEYPNPNGNYIVDFLTTTNTAYPNLTELIDIGDAWLASHGGYARDIWVLRITNEDPSFGDIADKPVFFLFGTIHAREVAIPELAIRYIKYLTEGYDGEGGYGTDPDATWLVDHNVLYVLVMQNPDGHWVNEQNSSEWWRKNLDNDDGCNLPDDWGVDLNRNHSFLWGCCGGSDSYPCGETYRGPSAGSEPETQAFQDFFATVILDQNGDNGDNEIAPASPLTTTGIFLTMHSYSDLVLWPWGFDNYGDSPNFTQLQTIGRKFSYFTNYNPSGTIWYDVDGATDDWTYGKFGVASFTFEVGPSGGTCGSFFPAYECIDGESGYPEDFWAENKPAFLYAHKIASTPYMTAYGPDAQDLLVVPDEVYRGQPVDLSATIQDHRYGGDPLGQIGGAEYFIDAPGNDGAGFPMVPVDGSWGELSEDVSAVVDTSDLEAGQHYILVHGQNEEGDWGPFSAVFLTVSEPDYGAALLPEIVSQQADPGQTVTYTLEVDNYGAFVDTYTITLDSLWSAAAPTSIGPIDSGESAFFDVVVNIPLSATNGESDTATVGILSQNDPSVSDSSSLETTANYYDPSFSPGQDSAYGLPGDDVVYSLEVTNLGNTIDSFDLIASGSWAVTAPGSVGPLEPGEGASIDVTVSIPVSAQPGDSDLSSLTLTSQGDASKSAYAELTTIAGVLGPLVSPDQITLYGEAGTIVEYTLVITNAGDNVDNFNISVSGATWDVDAPNTSGLTPPGSSRAIQVAVTIPEDALGGESDTATIEISSDRPDVVPVYADLTTIVAAQYALAVNASIDTRVASQPGDTVSFEVQVTNLGDAPDTYDLNAVSDWQVSLPASAGPLQPGETAVVVVDVQVPLDADMGAVNITTLSAVSQNDPQVTGQVILTTILGEYQLYLPISFKP